MSAFPAAPAPDPVPALASAANAASVAIAAAPLLSVVVPVKDEQERIVAALDPLVRWESSEVIAAIDSGSGDASAARAASVPGVRVVVGPGRGRGATLAAGARAARGRYLVFLHADSRLAEAAVRAAIARLGGRTVAAAFRIRLESPRRIFRLLEAGIHLRSRLGLPYGDQGLVIAREVFERAGGFRTLPRCEDLDLVLRLRRLGRIAIVPGPCSTSTRRWDGEGVLPVTARNLTALARFLVAGTTAEGDADDALSENEFPRVDRGGDPAVAPRRSMRG